MFVSTYFNPDCGLSKQGMIVNWFEANLFPYLGLIILYLRSDIMHYHGHLRMEMDFSGFLAFLSGKTWRQRHVSL